MRFFSCIYEFSREPNNIGLVSAYSVARGVSFLGEGSRLGCEMWPY